MRNCVRLLPMASNVVMTWLAEVSRKNLPDPLAHFVSNVDVGSPPGIDLNRVNRDPCGLDVGAGAIATRVDHSGVDRRADDGSVAIPAVLGIQAV
jgi:hypothetical protein